MKRWVETRYVPWATAAGAEDDLCIVTRDNIADHTLPVGVTWKLFPRHAPSKKLLLLLPSSSFSQFRPSFSPFFFPVSSSMPLCLSVCLLKAINQLPSSFTQHQQAEQEYGKYVCMYVCMYVCVHMDT